MPPRLTLITGAARGIGLELTRQCAARGDHVVAAARKPSAELERLAGSAQPVEIAKGVDVTDSPSLAALAAQVGERRIDLLILNAGILERQSALDLDLESVRRQLEVNAVGPLAVTKALLPRLARGSKLAVVTSRMGSLADNGSGAYYGYRMSKAAVNMAFLSLAKDLTSRGVAVVLLHPGFVQTDMTGGAGDVDARTSAGRLLARIEELTIERTGRFMHANGEELPW